MVKCKVISLSEFVKLAKSAGISVLTRVSIFFVSRAGIGNYPSPIVELRVKIDHNTHQYVLFYSVVSLLLTEDWGEMVAVPGSKGA